MGWARCGRAPDGGRVVIPYGLPEDFCQAGPLSEPPPPRAVFTSNPLRSLDWLLEIWAESIQPRVAGAELQVFAGAATYGSVGADKEAAMEKVLDRARALQGQGVKLRGPVPKARLIQELHQSRAMLYRGDLNETFCLAVGEAQAMGVPTVVEKLGSVSERVIDGETGFVAVGAAAFAESADDFEQVIASDCRNAGAALRFILSQDKIGSEIVDNLNASIHLRAVLTDLFLYSEALEPLAPEEEAQEATGGVETYDASQAKS